ncbi:hypothetical protein Tco_1029788 [Tanacetum coccineum]|uniref:Xylulose kinase-1 n=1 Tax=Tanacetum coccineum TaxID=301880 RepID=A0ABQ5G4E7_9ASTR
MSQPANDEFSQHLSDDEESNHEDASDTGAAPKQQQQVIQNGNSKKRISTRKDGIVRILSPVTATEIQVVEKERKAKNILLMVIPKEHMRRFHKMDDAKEIWEAIRTRFGGNANSKKMQKAVFKQQFEAFTISSSEGENPKCKLSTTSVNTANSTNGVSTASTNLVLPVLINTASRKELVLLMVKAAELKIRMHGDYFGMFIFELIDQGVGSTSGIRVSIVLILSPVTAAEIQAVEKERKAKNILLMAIPKEHMRRFHRMDDAKEIWEAIRTRFGGNANSKKMQKAVFKQQFEAFTISSSEGLEKGYDRFQQLLSQLEAHGAEVSTEDANHKFLRSLPPAWSNLAMTMRTKP